MLPEPRCFVIITFSLTNCSFFDQFLVSSEMTSHSSHFNYSQLVSPGRSVVGSRSTARNGSLARRATDPGIVTVVKHPKNDSAAVEALSILNRLVSSTRNGSQRAKLETLQVYYKEIAEGKSKSAAYETAFETYVDLSKNRYQLQKKEIKSKLTIKTWIESFETKFYINEEGLGYITLYTDFEKAERAIQQLNHLKQSCKSIEHVRITKATVLIHALKGLVEGREQMDIWENCLKVYKNLRKKYPALPEIKCEVHRFKFWLKEFTETGKLEKSDYDSDPTSPTLSSPKPLPSRRASFSTTSSPPSLAKSGMSPVFENFVVASTNGRRRLNSMPDYIARSTSPQSQTTQRSVSNGLNSSPPPTQYDDTPITSSSRRRKSSSDLVMSRDLIKEYKKRPVKKTTGKVLKDTPTKHRKGSVSSASTSSQEVNGTAVLPSFSSRSKAQSKSVSPPLFV